jgi:hypothetical protein
VRRPGLRVVVTRAHHTGEWRRPRASPQHSRHRTMMARGSVRLRSSAAFAAGRSLAAGPAASARRGPGRRAADPGQAPAATVECGPSVPARWCGSGAGVRPIRDFGAAAPIPELVCVLCRHPHDRRRAICTCARTGSAGPCESHRFRSLAGADLDRPDFTHPPIRVAFGVEFGGHSLPRSTNGVDSPGRFEEFADGTALGGESRSRARRCARPGDQRPEITSCGRPCGSRC